MADQDLERDNPATPFKLEKAKERGQVAKSQDVVTVTTLFFLAAVLAWQGPGVLKASAKLLHKNWMALNTVAYLSGDGLVAIIFLNVSHVFNILAPLLIGVAVVAFASSILQIGFVFSSEPLKFDWTRLNPVAGLKKNFGKALIFNIFKSVVKLVLISWVLQIFIMEIIPIAMMKSQRNADALAYLILESCSNLAFQICLVLLPLALLDLWYSKREFHKQMRMSKKELKDEHKQREGDPRIKSRIRELQREARKRSRSLNETKKADVLLTNPTHVAVALRYVHGEMDAPQILAKGQGHIATSMRYIAAIKGIPVVQSPSLARKLYKELEIDEQIPPHLFAEVARIIVWVFAMRDARQVSRNFGGKA